MDPHTLGHPLIPSRSRHPAVWLAVLLLHGALLWTWLNAPAPERARPSAPEPVFVGVWALSPARPRPAPLETPPTKRREDVTATRQHALTTPALSAESPPIESRSVAESELRVLPPTPASAPPLDLRWQRDGATPASRSILAQALNDPRANGRVTRLGDDPTVRFAEQSLGEGRRRLIVDGRCVESRDTRSATLDPSSISGRTMQLFRPCD